MRNRFVGVYWGARSEPRESCAQRVADCILRLSPLSRQLDRWFRKGRSKSAAELEIPTDPTAIASLLKTQRRDVGGAAMPDLGFSFSAWNGESVSFAVTCGSSSPFVRNSAVIAFEPGEEPSLALLRRILEVAVEAFDPDEGVVSSAGSGDGGDSSLSLKYSRDCGIH